jgi:hypothetical protein
MIGPGVTSAGFGPDGTGQLVDVSRSREWFMSPEEYASFLNSDGFRQALRIDGVSI